MDSRTLKLWVHGFARTVANSCTDAEWTERLSCAGLVIGKEGKGIGRGVVAGCTPLIEPSLMDILYRIPSHPIRPGLLCRFNRDGDLRL
jgi:hypothetical protein